MLRRLVPLTLLAASAAVAVPATASATSASTPVSVFHDESFYASADLLLPDGRTASVSLDRHRSSYDMSWHDFVSVTLYDGKTFSGYATDVPDDQVRFDRDLGTAALGTTVTDPEAGSADLSIVFTADGPATRSSYGSTSCQQYDSELCHSRREEVTRAAAVTMTLGSDTATGTGTLFHGLGMDIAPPSVVRAGSAY